MAITTGGGVAFDEGESVRNAGNMAFQTIGQMDQRKQFTQQQALQAGVQKYYQLEKEREAWVAGGGDMNTFTAKNASLFGEVQQLFSVATGKPLTMDQALQTGFGALSDFARANETLKSKVHADLQNPYGVGDGSTTVGKGGAVGAVPAPAPATVNASDQGVHSVRIAEPRAGGGASEGALTPGKKAVYMGLRTMPGSNRDGQYQVTVLIDGKEQYLSIPNSVPPGEATVYARKYLLGQGVIQQPGDFSLPSTPTGARAREAEPTPGALSGGAPMADQVAPQWSAPQWSATQAVTPGVIVPAQQQPTVAPGNSSLPGDNVYAQAPQAVSDIGGTSEWASLLRQPMPAATDTSNDGVSGAGPRPGTVLPPRPLGQQATRQDFYASHPESRSVETRGFQESISSALPGISEKAAAKLGRALTPEQTALPSATPKVDAKVAARTASLINKAFDAASATVDKMVASAAARQPGTDMVPLTQRDLAPVKEVAKRIQIESEKLASGTPEARRAAYLAAKEYVTTARPEELEAAGLSAVADRRQAILLTQMQMTAAVDSAQAKAGSKEAAAVIDMRAKAMEQATKIIEVATTAAKNDPAFKGDLTKFLAANPYYTRVLSMWTSAAAGQEVSVDMIMKDPSGFAKFFGAKPTASGTGLNDAAAQTQAGSDQIDAMIQALSQQ
jgi:hypothetical protein